ncbi:hypothetical protein B0A55_05036 [Friedmanniomyces simplex]|uniref:Zinc finger PHD-type domain-containing protein n=1 Tax=Friedmanniomyces simplex TaxID=329884 RepID=A0A4V5NGG8_9PEZI|nr:hypothetical protein B0A55_05036 [Friedmanniomyces simplex]
MNDSRRKFAANACLYHTLAVREPRLFLQRNLNTVLNAHQQLQLLTTRGGAAADASAASAASTFEAMMIANERRKAGWDFPTREMLGDLTRGRRPVLRIERLGLRLRSGSKGGGGGCGGGTRQVRPGDVELDWLPDPNVGLRSPCHVLVTVLDTRTAAKKEVVRVTRGCVVVQHVHDNGESSFDVELAQSILIELDQLLVETESGSNGFRHWKRTTTAKYSLEVTIHCQDSEQSAELLGRLHSRPVEHYKGVPASESRVKAVWEDLPSCPPTGHLLPLKRAQGHKATGLQYGMDISMGWSRRKDSPLELYNRSRENQNNQLPTPSSSDVQESSVAKEKQHIVRYVRHMGVETWATVEEGLRCIFCANAARGGRADMYLSKSALKESATTLDRLLLHYWSCHGFYEWQKVATPVSFAEQELVTIEIRPKKRHNAAPAAFDSPREEYSWIAPDRPFDIKAHIAGDERWTGGAQPKMEGRGRRGGPRHQAEQGAVRGAPKSARTSRLEEVEDLPPRKRQRIVMPLNADVTFYHSSSKAPIRPGEALSESEDESADDRLLHSQRRNLKQNGLTAEAVAFHEAFNRHLDVEQPSGKSATREAMVRFARKQLLVDHNGAWLEAFQAKLTLLSSHRVIDEQTLAYCLGLMDVDYGPPPGRRKGEDARKGAEEVEDGDGDTVMKDHGQAEDIRDGGPPAESESAGGSKTPLLGKQRRVPHKRSDGGTHRDLSTNGVAHGNRHSDAPTTHASQLTPPPPQTCFCGQRAQSGRGSIACENPGCAGGTFHLACVGLKRREKDWRCEACSAGRE